MRRWLIAVGRPRARGKLRARGDAEFLLCGVYGRRGAVQSKGHYCYFFCLGQKNDPDGTGPEPYVPADRLDTEIEAVYQRIQLAPAWLDQLREDIDAEVTERQHRDTGQREFLTRQLARAETQRRKLLDAYYTEPSTCGRSRPSRTGSAPTSLRPKTNSPTSTPPRRVAIDHRPRHPTRHPLRRRLPQGLRRHAAAVQPGRVRARRDPRRARRHPGVPRTLSRASA